MPKSQRLGTQGAAECLKGEHAITFRDDRITFGWSAPYWTHTSKPELRGRGWLRRRPGRSKTLIILVTLSGGLTLMRCRSIDLEK